MKKILVSLALFLIVTVSAQDALKEGVIISKQTMSSDNEQMKAQFEMMGEMLSTTYFKDTKSRSELANPMTGNVTTISDTETHEVLVLMDNPMYGKKYMLQKNEVTEEQIKNIDVVAGDEIKTVLGYECKQYTVKINQSGVEMKMELFTTEAIPVVSQQTAILGDKLKGFPLYMTMDMNQMGSMMTVTTEVTEIKKEKVSDDKFDMTPPEGYEKRAGQ